MKLDHKATCNRPKGMHLSFGENMIILAAVFATEAFKKLFTSSPQHPQTLRFSQLFPLQRMPL